MSYDPESPENLGLAIPRTTSTGGNPYPRGSVDYYLWEAQNGGGSATVPKVAPNGSTYTSATSDNAGNTRYYNGTTLVYTDAAIPRSSGGSGSVSVSLNPNSTSAWSTRMMPNGDLVRVNELTGEVETLVPGSTAPREPDIYTVNQGGKIYGINRDTGQIEWQQDVSTSGGGAIRDTFGGKPYTWDGTQWVPDKIASPSYNGAPSSSSLASSGSVGSSTINSVLSYLKADGGSSGGGGSSGNAADYAMRLGYQQKGNQIDAQYEQQKADIELQYQKDLLALKQNVGLTLADQQELAWRAQESALDRAQRAAEFAATQGIRQAELDLQRVTAFRDSMSSTDPGAVGAFLKAYGTIQNGLNQGGTALSDQAILPAAEILSQMQNQPTGGGIPPATAPLATGTPPVSAGGGGIQASPLGGSSPLPPAPTTGTTPPTTPTSGNSVTLPNGQVVPLTANGEIDFAAYLGIGIEPIDAISPNTAKWIDPMARDAELRAMFEQQTGTKYNPQDPVSAEAWLKWNTDMQKAGGDLMYGVAREAATGMWENEIDPVSLGQMPNGDLRFFHDPEGPGIVAMDKNTGETFAYRPGGALPQNAPKPQDVLGSQGQVVGQYSNPMMPPPPPPTSGMSPAQYGALPNYAQGTVQTTASAPYQAGYPAPPAIPYGADQVLNGVPQPLSLQSRAMGGPAMMNKPILVGEQGPELLMPMGNGAMNVIPLAGAMATGGTIAPTFMQWLKSQGATQVDSGSWNIPGQGRVFTENALAQYQAIYPPAAPAPAPAPAPIPTNPTSPTTPTQGGGIPDPNPVPTTPLPPANNLPPVTQPAPTSNTSTGQVPIPTGLQPTIDDLRQQREATPFEYINPYAVNYETVSPTLRQTSEMGLQTARGIPVQDLQAEWRKFRLPGVYAGSVNQGL